MAFPEVCLLTGVGLQLAKDLLAGLEVDGEAMAARVDDKVSSERVLALLTARLGKHRAQSQLHEAIRPGAEEPAPLEAAVRGLLEPDELREALRRPAVESAMVMVDEVVARSRAARLVEADQWG